MYPGAWCYGNMMAALEAMSLRLFTNVLGWTVQEVQELLDGVRQDFSNTRIHAYYTM